MTADPSSAETMSEAERVRFDGAALYTYSVEHVIIADEPYE